MTRDDEMKIDFDRGWMTATEPTLQAALLEFDRAMAPALARQARACADYLSAERGDATEEERARARADYARAIDAVDRARELAMPEYDRVRRLALDVTT